MIYSLKKVIVFSIIVTVNLMFALNAMADSPSPDKSGAQTNASDGKKIVWDNSKKLLPKNIRGEVLNNVVYNACYASYLELPPTSNVTSGGYPNPWACVTGAVCLKNNNCLAASAGQYVNNQDNWVMYRFAYHASQSLRFHYFMNSEIGYDILFVEINGYTYHLNPDSGRTGWFSVDIAADCFRDESNSVRWVFKSDPTVTAWGGAFLDWLQWNPSNVPNQTIHCNW